MREERIYDLLFEIREWHEKQFPDATCQDQLLKLEEELVEYSNAPTMEERYKEFADVLIVCAGLLRFPSMIGSHIRTQFILDYLFRNIDTQQAIFQALQAKLEKNKARTWTRLPDGRYKHTNSED